jgi:hypothetical protein
MQSFKKSLGQLFTLVVMLGLSIGASYVFAWTAPTQPPPNGNVPAPINVGSAAQVKDGGLGVNAISVFGNGYVQGNLGVGVTIPTHALEVAGPVYISKTDYTPANTFLNQIYAVMTGSSASISNLFGTLSEAKTSVTGTGLSTAIGVVGTGYAGTSGATNEYATGVLGQSETNPGNTGYSFYAQNRQSAPGVWSSTGGTQYGLYINQQDPDVTNYGVYEKTTGSNYFAGNVEVASPSYFQFDKTSVGAPSATDCDADSERGRESIDTTNNRLYICNGALRGWDWITLNN